MKELLQQARLEIIDLRRRNELLLEPLRDYLKEALQIVSRTENELGGVRPQYYMSYILPEGIHLVALWNALSPEVRDVISLRVKGKI